jgi:hypothetical protein
MYWIDQSLVCFEKSKILLQLLPNKANTIKTQTNTNCGSKEKAAIMMIIAAVNYS